MGLVWLGVGMTVHAASVSDFPSCPFPDTEVSTNVAPKGAFVVASGDNFRYLLLVLDCTDERMKFELEVVE